MSNNTIVRGLLVPSLKNKPLDGRQDVPTLADIVNIENPYVNFIFPVEETGKWYKVLSLTDKVIDELVIPNGMIDKYEEFGGGMTDTQKQEYLTKSLAEQMYLKKEDAVNEYLNKIEAEADYLKKKNAEESYQPKGDYQPSGDYATKQELEDLENRISQGGGSGEGGSFVDAPSDGKTYGRKNGLWNELVDAPVDGFFYARKNGEWAAIEGEGGVVTSLPILTINIKSSLGVDPIISDVKAKVAYADKIFYVSDGGKVNIPYGLTATITFPQVIDYETPEEIVIEEVMGDIARSVEYVHVRTSVNVYASTDDGASVDGQIVSVTISSESKVLQNGVFIEDVDGNLYDENTWVEGKTVNSIVIIADNLKVRTMRFTDNASHIFTTRKGIEDEGTAILDFTGEERTSSFSGRTPYATALNYGWKNGDTGAYIPALGELKVLADNWEKYLILMNLASISIQHNSLISSTPSANVYDSGSGYYFNYGINILSGNIITNKASSYSSFYFRKITNEDTFRLLTTEQHEILGGQASFTCLKGDNVEVSINNIENGHYSTPESVSFVSDGLPYNISFVYNKLTIDTIYINNLIADTDSIISGEMNGPAVQAIWNGVHRYLGKIVTKEDSTNELVLLDIDQNDNRYYTDGSMIDIEALGTNAYYFTRIPAFAYRITQMSDNIFKVEISYGYNPDNKNPDWKYVNETVISAFPCSSNNVPTYKEQVRVTANDTNFSKYGLGVMGIYRYSALVLLLFAKYGVDPRDKIEDVLDAGIFATDSYAYSGVSISNGKRDCLYNHTKSDGSISAKIPCILGIEQFYQASGVGTTSAPSSVWTDEAKFDVNSKQIRAIDNGEEIETIEGFEFVVGTTQYIKSLAITKFFWAFALRSGATSDTYYRKNSRIYQADASDGTWIKASTIASFTKSSATSRLLYAINNNKIRIELDREQFNLLENIWKS